jgi:hypothetical protein
MVFLRTYTVSNFQKHFKLGLALSSLQRGVAITCPSVHLRIMYLFDIRVDCIGRHGLGDRLKKFC